MRPTSGARSARLLAVIAVVLGLLAPGAPALAAAPTREEVYRALGVDEVPAQYVVLIDTSASMQQGENLYRLVRKSLRGFLAALEENDPVALVTFDREASVRFEGPAGRDPDALLATLPAAANGGHTDLGQAIETAVGLVRASDAPIATVVLFTDGAHDPAPGSPYPFAEGASWEALGRSATELEQERLLAYAVPLRGRAGIQPLRAVVPDAQVLPGTSIAALTRQLSVPKQDSRAARARTLLRADLERGLVVEWPAGLDRLSPGENTVELTIRATTEHVPLVLSDLQLTTDHPGIRLRTGAEAVRVQPGREVRKPLSIHWDAGDRSAAPLARRDIEASVTLNGRVDSPWAGVLRDDLGLTFSPTLGAAPTRVHGTAQRGSPVPWLLAAALATTVAAAMLVGVRGARRPRLSGRLRATSPVSGKMLGEIRLTGRRMQIGPTTLRIPGTGTVSAIRPPVGTAVRVGYSPTNAPDRLETVDCTPGFPVLLNGITFEWSGSDGELTPDARRRGRASPADA
jgi:hypothetical protein